MTNLPGKPRDPLTLCYVTDGRALSVFAAGDREAALLDCIRTAIAARIDWIQIREKNCDTRQLLRLARAAVAASRDAGSTTRILLNDRLDVALAAGAAGVHLGENSVPASVVAKSARSFASPDFLVGVSCHSVEAAQQAARDGAGYLFFGPIFATPSKAAFGAPQGLARLREVCRAVNVPVLAIGGITAQNAAACREAGATGVAAIRPFQEAPDVTKVVAEIRQSTL
jgi:thiamine-phosphate pyrophosphorylase